MSDGLDVVSTDLAKLDEVLARAATEVGTTLRTSLETSAREIGREVFRKGAERMPARGGFRAELADSSGQVAVVDRGSEVEVTIEGKSPKGYALSKIDETGIVFHPVWGHRPVWVTQHVPAHAFTDEFQRYGDNVEQRLRNDLGDLLQHVAREG